MSASVSNAAEDGLAIGELLKTGWQIGGFSQAFDNRRILAEQLLSEGYTLERPEELNEAAILRWQQGGR